MSKKHIEECVRESLQGYFRDLGGETPDGKQTATVSFTPSGAPTWA